MGLFTQALSVVLAVTTLVVIPVIAFVISPYVSLPFSAIIVS